MKLSALRSLSTLATFSAILLGLTLSACGKPDASNQASAPHLTSKTVYTTFYPTTFWAQQIAGDLLEVVCPLPGDADPIFWKPSADDILAYQKAALIISNGAGFERWMTTTSLPLSRVVDTAAGFENAFLHIEGLRNHSHGGQGEHSHEGLDGHTWLDPVLAGVQARAILEAFCQRWPEHADAFRANHKRLAAQFEELDAAFAKLAPKLKGVKVLCSHPAYQYLAKRYGWSIVNFDLDPGAELTGAALALIKEAAASTPDNAMRTMLLWESEPLPATVQRLAKVGVESLLLSPCEMPDPESGDYFQRMQANIDRLP